MTLNPLLLLQSPPPLPGRRQPLPDPRVADRRAKGRPSTAGAAVGDGAQVLAPAGRERLLPKGKNIGFSSLVT